MNTIRFTITREDVYDKVFATSAYTARARETMGTPSGITERMLLTADDKRIIDPMIDGSVNEIAGEIARYHPGSSVGITGDGDGAGYQFSIATPVNYPAGNADKLTGCLESYIANRTLQNWYTGIKPDEANIFAIKAQNDAMIILAMLTQRTKPTNPTNNA